MIHQDLSGAVISVVKVKSTSRAAASKYHVSNKKIIEVAFTFQSIQEERGAPLVESYNQQQISIWVRYNLCLP